MRDERAARLTAVVLLYVNLEDGRLQPPGAELPGDLLEVFYRTNREARAARAAKLFPLSFAEHLAAGAIRETPAWRWFLEVQG